MITRALTIPAQRLPADPTTRDEVLTHYFADRVARSSRDAHGDWTVTVGVAPTAEFYVDPRLGEGLRWWGCGVEQIPYAHRRTKTAFISLSDAWTLLSASEWLARLDDPPPHATIIHLDDHDDLMSPRLGLDDDRFTDLLTGRSVDIHRPESVADAIASGAIGMGSFLAPLLHALPSVDIRHLCDTGYARTRADQFWLTRATEADTIVKPGARRPSIQLVPTSRQPPPELIAGTYTAGSDETNLFADVRDGPVFLHIDLDFFNNRFNADSDWASQTGRHDPPYEHLMRRVDQVVSALSPLRRRIIDVEIGISPGFFPAEFWEPLCDTLLHELARGDSSAE